MRHSVQRALYGRTTTIAASSRARGVFCQASVHKHACARLAATQRCICAMALFMAAPHTRSSWALWQLAIARSDLLWEDHARL